MAGRKIRLCGMFSDQRGTVTRGKITGYNGEGTPIRKYTWVEPEDKKLKGKTFEAFDDQIAKARSRCRMKVK